MSLQKAERGTHAPLADILHGARVSEGFPTTLGTWGCLLSEYYDAARSELPGEKAFWKSLVRPQHAVLEVGAGPGFLSLPLAEARPRSLTLLEPERENLRLLKLALESAHQRDTRPVLMNSKLETAQFAQKFDLILFPYDSLPMLTTFAERRQFIRIAAANLNPGGVFALHLSTEQWVRKEIERESTLTETHYTTRTKRNIRVRRKIRPTSSMEYVKLISIEDEQSRVRESYLALTSIVTPAEILESARLAGLEVQSRYSDFFRSGLPSSEAADDIYLFRKGLERV